MGLHTLCDVWGTCSQEYWTHKCTHLPWSHWEGDGIQDTAMSQPCRVTSGTTERQQKGRIFPGFYCKCVNGLCSHWLEENVNFFWVSLYTDPFCILFCWDSGHFWVLFTSDPVCAVGSVSCLHHSTATLSSISLPFKHEGEMKLNVHIRGRWLAPVLQWYLRDFLHVISAAQKEMKVFLTANTFFSLPSSALLWMSEDSLHCFSQRSLFPSHLRSI